MSNYRIKTTNYFSTFLLSMLFSLSLLTCEEKDQELLRKLDQLLEKHLRSTEGYILKLKKATPLTQQDQNKSPMTRIKEHFIGDIPPEITSAINYFTYHEEYVKNNVNISNRILLYGEPGTGKTHLFEVMAQELQLPSLYFHASFFADKYIGEASRKIRKVFEVAKELSQPIIIFIDEIDAIRTKRKESTYEQQRGSLMTLLTEIQEAADNKNILIIVATNDLEALDNAVKDRFPATCHIPRLNREKREELIMKYFRDLDLPLDNELAKRLAEATEKYKCSFLPDSEKNLHPDVQKKSWKECSYSNRDLEHIIMTAKERQFTDCKISKKNCTKKLCTYFAEVMDSMHKMNKNPQGKRIINCDNM